MNLRAQRKALLDEAAKLAKTVEDEGREFTDDEITRIGEIKSEVAELDDKIAKADAAKAALDDLSKVDDDDLVADDVDVTAGLPQPRKAKGRFGEVFVKSPEFERFRKDYPTGVGAGSVVNIGRVKAGSMAEWMAHRKALTTSQAEIPNIRMPLVDQVDRDRLTLLDLISRGTTGGNFEYLQVIGVDRGAAIVPESTIHEDGPNEGEWDDAGLKPLSNIATELADAKVFTYADGYEVTNQLLSDAPALASYLNNELSYSLDNIVEHYLLNGSGSNGEPVGLLNTTGVQQQSFDTDMVTTIRKAITRVTRLGGSVTAVLMSPEDDEAWDLLKDDVGRYYGQGPFGSGPGTAWGRPRAVSERLSPGQVILGDFRQIALLDREGLSIQAFNQHKDYAQRNLTYVRAELRAAQVIWRPNRLVVVDVSGAGYS